MMKKYLIGFAILILYFGGMACCLLFGTPRWVAGIWIAIVVAYLVGGSIYRLIYPGGAKYSGDIFILLPLSWWRWLRDKPEMRAKAKV